MNRTLAVLALVVLPALAECNGSDGPEPLTVTYVANCGFIAECEGKKVLVDALFGGFEANWCYVPSDSLVALMKTVEPPFDEVDVIAVTHAHVDHMGARIVAEHMLNNSHALLVCPPQVESTLVASEHYAEIRTRIRAIVAPRDSVVSVDLNGVGVTIYPGQHSPYIDLDTLTGEDVDMHRNVQHYEYVFDISGRRLYHSGDAIMNDIIRYESLGFGADSIDVACVGWWDMGEMIGFRHKLIRDVVRAKRIILTHMSPSRPPRGHPTNQPPDAEVLLPTYPLQRWAF